MLKTEGLQDAFFGAGYEMTPICPCKFHFKSSGKRPSNPVQELHKYSVWGLFNKTQGKISIIAQ